MEFQRFGTASNFKVNYNKLEILNISLPSEVLKTTLNFFPIQDWVYLYMLSGDSDSDGGVSTLLFFYV